MEYDLVVLMVTHLVLLMEVNLADTMGYPTECHLVQMKEVKMVEKMENYLVPKITTV